MITRWPYRVTSVPTEKELEYVQQRDVGYAVEVGPSEPLLFPSVTLTLAATQTFLLAYGFKQGDPVPSLYIVRPVLEMKDVEDYPLGSTHWIDYPLGNGLLHQTEQPSFDTSPSAER